MDQIRMFIAGGPGLNLGSLLADPGSTGLLFNVVIRRFHLGNIAE